MLDPYLAAIVQAAEEGVECPIVWMTLTSGDLVVGIPSASDVFIEGFRKVLADANQDMAGVFESRRKIDKRREEASALADEAIALFEARVEPSRGHAITLTKTTVVRSGGDSAEIPVMRVNLDTIAAWWIVNTKFKGKTGAIVGVAF